MLLCAATMGVPFSSRMHAGGIMKGLFTSEQLKTLSGNYPRIEADT